MGLGINTNVPGIVARRQATQSSNRLTDDLKQLSSALRINSASDDAAGLAIAERFRTQIRQFNAEISALQSGISAIDTAEGGLDAQQDTIGRLRELALQASNGTLTDEQRQSINQEAQQLLQQIDSTAQNTTFNEIQPLSGPNTQVVLDATGNTTVEFQESTVQSLGLDGLDLSTQAGAQSAINALDAASQGISSNRSSLGAQSNRLHSAIQSRDEASLNAQSAESRVRDLDLALATIERSRNQLLLRGALGALVQSNLVNQNAARLLGG